MLALQRYISFELLWEAEKVLLYCFCEIIPSELPFLGLFGKAHQCQLQPQKQECQLNKELYLSKNDP